MALRRLGNGEFQFANPKWNTTGGIDVEVILDSTGESIPFTARGDDSESHGVELFNLLSTTYSAQIAPVTSQEVYDDLVVDALLRRNRELRESDWIASRDIELQNQLEWLQYRQDLRDITRQVGFPTSINWTEKPALTPASPVVVGVTTIGDA